MKRGCLIVLPAMTLTSLASGAAVLDLAGNRQSFTDRLNQTTPYALANPANEYATIGGAGVSYDAAGNLSRDEAGRYFDYDEAKRLSQVRASNGITVLASFTYDALGRRITATIGSTTSRYDYDGQSVIEERNSSDVRTRYHINGAQYVDERVATYTDATGQFTYYLLGDNYSITGTGYADGGNLYEAFGSNGTRFVDPSGEGVLTWLLVGNYSLSDWEAIKSGALGDAASGAAAALGSGIAQGIGNAVAGAGQTAKELGLVVRDQAVLWVDVPATYLGYPLNVKLLSQFGQASERTGDTLELTLETAKWAGANIVTLGAANVIKETAEYVVGGDVNRYQENTGGPALLTLGTAAAARAISGIADIQRAGSAKSAAQAAEQQAAPKSVSPAVKAVGDDVTKFLGKDARVITNSAGDTVFLSKDGLRRVRFDINNPSPHLNPHSHVEINVNGKWVKSGPLYPSDVTPK